MATEKLYAHGGHLPQIADSAYVAPGAFVIGRVQLGADANVWFNSVLRGDVHDIVIGDRTNIQDLSMVHVTSGQFGTFVGSDVTVGHRAILHGCTIGNGCLIGMGSVVLDGVELGDFCLVGAGAVVTPGKKIPARSVVLGNPGRIVRQVTDEEVESFLDSARHYAELARTYRSSFDVI